jgi:ABC-type transport system involved in cytochrome c biogenesis permease subunit
LALTFICGLTALILTGLHKLKFAHKKDSTIYDYHIQQESLRILSLIFLYPAITTMGLGIFIGAIWANISWGTYWSWDPKETWALITFLIYSIVLHTQSLPCFKKPAIFHIYITLAFLSILMTFFGVNYLLGGMHSYA